jgi:hypothetical protein
MNRGQNMVNGKSKVQVLIFLGVLFTGYLL